MTRFQVFFNFFFPICNPPSNQCHKSDFGVGLICDIGLGQTRLEYYLTLIYGPSGFTLIVKRQKGARLSPPSSVKPCFTEN